MYISSALGNRRRARLRTLGRIRTLVNMYKIVKNFMIKGFSLEFEVALRVLTFFNLNQSFQQIISFKLMMKLREFDRGSISLRNSANFTSPTF